MAVETTGLQTAAARSWAAELARDLDELWRTLPTSDGVPGAVVRVAGSGAAPWSLFFTAGNARADQPRPMSEADGFHVASVGKAMTAALLLQLTETGALSLEALDTPVEECEALSDLLPLIPVLTATVGGGVTLRQMLQHTSGLRDAFGDDGVETAGASPAPRSLSRELARLAREDAMDPEGNWPPWSPDRPGDPHGGVLNWFIWGGAAASAPVFRPGERFHYSDTAYMLIALLAERLAGQPYATLLRTEIFEPLGMRDTFLAYSAEAPKEWRTRVSDFTFAGRPAFSSGLDVSWDWGGGGQVSTAGDLALFLRGLLEGRLFRKRGTLALMTDFITPRGMPEGCVGLGLGVRKLRSPAGVELVGHAGAWGVQAFYAPTLDVTITGTFNQSMGTHPRLRTWLFEVADSVKRASTTLGV